MVSSRSGEKRHAKRFEIDCPVTVGIRGRGNGHGLEQGRLHDIGVRGARFCLSRPLGVGTRIILHIHFRDASERVSTVRFEGIVTRAKQVPPHEIVVRFRRGGRFLRNDLENLFNTQQSA